MGASTYVGRVGGLALFFGVGSAIVLGGGCGIASADGTTTPHSTAGASTNDTDGPSTKKPRAKVDRTERPTSTKSVADADDASGPAGHRAKHRKDRPSLGGESDSKPEVSAPEDDSPSSTREARHRLESGLPRPRGFAHSVNADATAASTQKLDVARSEPDVPRAGVELDPVEAVVSAPKLTAPKVAEVVEHAVAGIVATLSRPLSPGTAPEAPVAQPGLAVTAAFTRRELETASAASIASEAQVAPADNTLTYTAKPTIVDQLTVAGLRVLRTVSNVIGVDLFAEFNKLLISKSPPILLTLGLDARKTEVELDDGTTWTAWEFRPPNATDKTVIAIHGSGFIYEPNVMQWYDYSSMARDTGATVVVPLYPLATTEAGSAQHVVPEMADFISQQIEAHSADNVSVYGDSAGSIIAIAAVEQLVLAGRPVPSRMVLLSLTPDGSLSNPDIKNTDDPVVDVNNLGDYAASHWADGLDPADPLYNALYFPTLVGLPPTTIYVGSTEFVLPDTLLLYQKAVDEGAPISVVVGQGQIHDWALGGLPINSQAPKVRSDIYRQLGLT